MKTRFLLHILFLMGLLPTVANGQNFLIGVSSGYKYSLNNYEGYSNAGSVPLNLRIGGGLRVLQFGVEYSYQALRPTYLFYDPFLSNDAERFREEFKEHDFTGFLRLSTQKYDDGHAFFFVTNFGANFSSKSVKRPDIGEFANISYKPALLFKTSIGGSFALASPVHLDIEIQYGYNFGRVEDANDEIQDVYNSKFKSHGIGFHMGLSYTFLN